MIRRSRCATAPASHSNPTVGTATGRRRYDNVRCGKTRVINAWFPPPHEATAPDLHSGRKSRDDGGGTEQMEAIELMRSMRAERNLAWPSKHAIARTEHGATRVGLRELRPSGGLTTPVPRSGHPSGQSRAGYCAAPTPGQAAAPGPRPSTCPSRERSRKKSRDRARHPRQARAPSEAIAALAANTPHKWEPFPIEDTAPIPGAGGQALVRIGATLYEQRQAPWAIRPDTR